MLRGTSTISENELRHAFELALSRRAATDKRNIGTPFIFTAREQVSVLCEVFRKTFPVSSHPRFIEPAFDAFRLYEQAETPSSPVRLNKLDTLKKAIEVADRETSTNSGFAFTVAIFAKLGASDRLSQLAPVENLSTRLRILVSAAEAMQDAELYLDLFKLFAQQRDQIKAFASLEDAIFADMRNSTDKHLDECRHCFDQYKITGLFSEDQARYIQSLFDRFVGSLE